VELLVLTAAGSLMIDDLFDLIGGNRTIRAATESFYDKVLADDSLRHFFKRTDMAHLRARQRMFISMLLGGPAAYTGKDVHEAHAWARNHGLHDTHFDLFLNHFREALEEVGVNSDEAKKVIKLLEDRRHAVLNP
jgi:hemoglobin